MGTMDTMGLYSTYGALLQTPVDAFFKKIENFKEGVNYISKCLSRIIEGNLILITLISLLPKNSSFLEV